jgi:hypothetical protein
VNCLIFLIVWLPAAGAAAEPMDDFTTQLRPDLYLSACAFEYYFGFHRDLVERQSALMGAGGNIIEFNLFFSRLPIGFGGRVIEATTSNAFFNWSFPVYYYVSMLAPHITYTTRYAKNSFDLLTVSGCYLTDVQSIAVEYRRVFFIKYVPGLINTEVKTRAAYFSYDDPGQGHMNGYAVGIGIKIGLGYWGVTRIPVRKR